MFFTEKKTILRRRR